MNIRTIGGAIALAALVGTGIAADRAPAQAQAAPVPMQYWQRGDRGSDRNLIQVRQRLEASIDQLQRDQHDYGGFCVRAIASLQQARADIEEALEYDRSHSDR